MLKNNGFHNRHSPILRAFSPLSLFSGGAPGAWYDPSDYGATGTLFQDSAGTTPVTAVEQPVGLMLDKSQGLVLGSELVTNGDFSSGASWTLKTGATISGGTLNINATGDIFKIAAQSIGISSANKWYRIRVACSNYVSGIAFVALGDAGLLTRIQISANGTYEALFYYSNPGNEIDIRAFGPGGTGTTQLSLDNISVRELPGNHAFQATSASRPVLSARVNKLLATATLATQSVTTRAAAHTLRFEGAGSITLSGTATGTFAAGSHSVTATAGTLTLTVSGSVTSADLRETNDGVGVPAYQAVVTSTNYDTTGFLPYLKFDGVDDSLSTNSISFTSTDKMSVFAGVRKLVDTFQMYCELSASISANNGTFLLYGGGTGTQQWLSKGTVAVDVGSTPITAPITQVLTGVASISTDVATLRINGTQAATSAADQGTGNYGNYPLFIGSRNNASQRFNGQMYSMIIVGKSVTAGELSSTETYVNQKTGAY